MLMPASGPIVVAELEQRKTSRLELAIYTDGKKYIYNIFTHTSPPNTEAVVLQKCYLY